MDESEFALPTSPTNLFMTVADGIKQGLQLPGLLLLRTELQERDQMFSQHIRYCSNM